MRNPTILMAAVLVTAAIASSACSQQDDPAPKRQTTITTLREDAIEQKWRSQEELLTDGEVTQEDLDTAVANYRSCVEAYGLSVSQPTINRVDGWRRLMDVNYNGVTDQDVIDDANDCSASQVSLIEVGYEITHKAQMDQPLMGWVRECLRKRGLSTTGAEQNIDDLAAGDDTRLEAIQTCVQAGAHALYPREPLAITY